MYSTSGPAVGTTGCRGGGVGGGGGGGGGGPPRKGGVGGPHLPPE